MGCIGNPENTLNLAQRQPQVLANVASA